MREQFWQKFRLEQLTQEEWEALCDGCALCCVHKLEDEDSGDIAVTDICCEYLDMDTCSCRDYANRHVNVPDCVPFDVEAAKSFYWLPETCAYRRMANGQPLPEWHYLQSGDRQLVHEQLLSARYQSISEHLVHPDEWEERVVRWVDAPEEQQ